MRRASLGELATFTSGGTPSRQSPEFYTGDIPWITGADIDASGHTSARSHVTQLAIEKSAASVVPAGTVLLVTRTSVGKVGIPTTAISFSQDITAVHHDKAQVDRGFLVQFLRTQTAHFTARARGATIMGVTRDAVTDLVIPLPPLPEQRRIAAILDEADGLRINRRRTLALHDDLTHSIFLDMFGDPMKNSLGLPSRSIGDVAKVVTGNTPSRADAGNFGGSLEWIKSDNLGREIASPADEQLSEAGRRKARVVPAGSVLVTCIAGSRRSIGKCSLVDREVAFNQQINAVLPGAALHGSFLLAQLRCSPDLVRAKSSGGMKGLVSKSSFASIQILLPPLELQHQFVRRVEAARAARHAAEADQLDELFASLQSRAFSGRL